MITFCQKSLKRDGTGPHTHVGNKIYVHGFEISNPCIVFLIEVHYFSSDILFESKLTPSDLNDSSTLRAMPDPTNMRGDKRVHSVNLVVWQVVLEMVQYDIDRTFTFCIS